MADTPSIAASGLKTIGASCSQNTSDTSSRKGCEKDVSEVFWEREAPIVFSEGAEAIA